MQDTNELSEVPKRSWRPKEQFCPTCRSCLKRSHILWRKQLFLLTGPVKLVNWAYHCSNPTCPDAEKVHRSTEAETLHLKHRRFGRDVIVHVGYRRFWYHQTMYEIHEWLTQELGLPISDRHVLNLIGDFLALLRAAQPAKIRAQLQTLKHLIVGLDGMQLTQKVIGADEEDQRVAVHIDDIFRNRWWGLFTCYDVEDLPRTNNELERYMRRIKTGNRRITSRKNVHDFIIRYGRYAACVDYKESVDDLLGRLHKVSHEDFLRERQVLDTALLREQKRHRFRHRQSAYLQELEERWMAAIEKARS